MRTYLGEFEQLLLLALLHVKDEAYGVADSRRRSRSGRAGPSRRAPSTPRSIGSSGAISCPRGWAIPRAQRGGKRKRYYRLEPAGATLLRESQHALARMARGVSPELETS